MIEIIPALRERLSRRSFSRRPIEPEVLLSIAEAFRWAPSNSNRQPWSLVFAESAEARRNWDLALHPTNLAWAESAPIKMVIVGNPEEQPDHNGLQAFALDCGLAIQNILIQACAVGLSVRAMAGWEEAKLRVPFAIADPNRIVALIAAGYPGGIEDLPDTIQQKERRPRTRKSLESIVFRDRLNGASLKL